MLISALRVSRLIEKDSTVILRKNAALQAPL